MATFRVDGGIPVTLPDGLSQEALLGFPPFQNWLRTLRRSLALQTRAAHPFHAEPYALRSLTVQAYDVFGGGRLGFVKLTADVATAAGARLPGSVFLRGPSVAVLVLLVPADAAPGGAAEAAERRAVLTGLRDQGEKITLKLVKMKDLWKAGGRDAKCLAALALWEGLKREGKI